jgi:glucan phosphorylase
MGKLGIDCKAFRNTGTYATPAWTEVALVRDATLNLEWENVDAPSRASRVKEMLKTIVGVDADLSVKASDTDAGYIALWDAAMGQNSIDMLFLNGGTAQNGARGVRFHALITSATEDQGITTALYDSMKAVPSALRPAGEGLKTAVVTSGAPVFTAI